MADPVQECATFDVAIVGAGPVGASLAALLGQAGLTVFVGETSETIYPLPRAAHFDHEIMRIFQQLGIADAIAPSIIASDRYLFRNKAGDLLLDFDLRQPADTGWHGYMMHQPGIEKAIRDRIACDPGITLRTGVSFETLSDEGDHVVSTWRGPEGAFAIRSAYLVGCDGAWSPVRENLGIGLEDLAFDEPWLVLDLLVDEDNDLPTLNIQLCDPARPTTYIVMGMNRRRFEFMLLPGETPEDILDDDRIAALVAGWGRKGVLEVERKAVYRFHALVAREWNKGRVLLAGDAAHQMPPFAGQGMCSGVRDAHALSWRLPLAIRGGDGSALLATYQPEREPHVRAITAAAIETGRVVCTLDPVMAEQRDLQMFEARRTGAPLPDISSPPIRALFGLPDTPHAGERFFQPVVSANGKPVRLDDILGPGAWLIARERTDHRAIDGVRSLSLGDAALTPFAAKLRGWLNEAGTGAVLVRGDRYIFGTGEAAELLDAFAAQAGLVRAGRESVSAA